MMHSPPLRYSRSSGSQLCPELQRDRLSLTAENVPPFVTAQLTELFLLSLEKTLFRNEDDEVVVVQ